jgi:hypothetical protein
MKATTINLLAGLPVPVVDSNFRLDDVMDALAVLVAATPSAAHLRAFDLMPFDHATGCRPCSKATASAARILRGL